MATQAQQIQQLQQQNFQYERKITDLKHEVNLLVFKNDRQRVQFDELRKSVQAQQRAHEISIARLKVHNKFFIRLLFFVMVLIPIRKNKKNIQGFVKVKPSNILFCNLVSSIELFFLFFFVVFILSRFIGVVTCNIS